MLKFIRKFILIIIICISYLLLAPNVNASMDEAFLAGGCFWCLEHDLEDLQGVISVTSGYTGGDMENPNYSNHNGHQEAVRVTYDSSKIDFPTLLRSYWRNIDPYDSEGQFCDRGDSYRPVIFTQGDEQKLAADRSLESVANKLNLSPEEIKVAINPAKKFWVAEEYHQDFAVRNPLKYKFYRYSCGRDARLEEVWVRVK